MNERKNILVFNERFFQVSESFIYHCIVGSIHEFSVHLLSFKFENHALFPLSDGVIHHRIPVQRSPLERMRVFFGNKIGRKESVINRRAEMYVKSILRDASIDLVHVHYGTNALSVLPLVRELGIPLVVTFHGFDASRSTLNPAYMNRLPELFDYASAIMIVSPHMIETLKLEPYMDKVKIIPYGIDAEFFKPQPKPPHETVNILHSGRLADKKGVPDLIRVFYNLANKYDDITLHIVGKGAELDRCVRLVADLKIPPRKVQFYGERSHAEIRNFMAEADIFVLNSRRSENGNMEGLPNSILEAMSMEKAVVSTYHAGIPLAIESGRNGLLVPERDNASLESAIERLFLDKSLRLQLGKEARKTVLEKFTVQKMQSNVNALYREVLRIN